MKLKLKYTSTNAILTSVLAALGQRAVDHVAEVRLQADVQEASEGQNLVDGIITRGRSQSAQRAVGALAVGLQLRGDVVILNGLEELHGEEKEDSRSQLEVVGTSVHPPGREQADGREARRHFTSETHLSTQVPQRTSSTMNITFHRTNGSEILRHFNPPKSNAVNKINEAC